MSTDFIILQCICAYIHNIILKLNQKKKESYNKMFFHFSFTATSKFLFTCYKKLSWKILDDIIAAKWWDSYEKKAYQVSSQRTCKQLRTRSVYVFLWLPIPGSVTHTHIHTLLSVVLSSLPQDGGLDVHF